MADHQAPPAGKPLRIMVVDDDDAVRETLCDMLRAGGLEMTAARNGEEALRLFAAAAADVVITDIIMPAMEGIETIRELRTRRGDVKIIAISGGGRVGVADYLELAKKLGADATLSKPFTRDTLLAVLAKLNGDGP